MPNAESSSTRGAGSSMVSGTPRRPAYAAKWSRYARAYAATSVPTNGTALVRMTWSGVNGPRVATEARSGRVTNPRTRSSSYRRSTIGTPARSEISLRSFAFVVGASTGGVETVLCGRYGARNSSAVAISARCRRYASSVVVPNVNSPWFSSTSPVVSGDNRPGTVSAQCLARSKPGITYGTTTTASPRTDRTRAAPSGWFVNAITASAWLCRTAGDGSSAGRSGSTPRSGAPAASPAAPSSVIIP